MWSNFTDFALKAQKDLQDQANEAASKLQQQLPPISVCFQTINCVTLCVVYAILNIQIFKLFHSLLHQKTTTTTIFRI